MDQQARPRQAIQDARSEVLTRLELHRQIEELYEQIEQLQQQQQHSERGQAHRGAGHAAAPKQLPAADGTSTQLVGLQGALAERTAELEALNTDIQAAFISAEIETAALLGKSTASNPP